MWQLLHFTIATDALESFRTTLLCWGLRWGRAGWASAGSRRSDVLDPVVFFFIQNIIIEQDPKYQTDSNKFLIETKVLAYLL